MPAHCSTLSTHKPQPHSAPGNKSSFSSFIHSATLFFSLPSHPLKYSTSFLRSSSSLLTRPPCSSSSSSSLSSCINVFPRRRVEHPGQGWRLEIESRLLTFAWLQQQFVKDYRSFARRWQRFDEWNHGVAFDVNL